jgi:tRNA threonylcarbamoyladenosine biosynthesis protein TsaB
MTNRSDPAGKVRPPTILAIETGGRACSVAIMRDGISVAHEHVATDHGHAAMLMPMIERLRGQAGCDYAAFDRIAVSVGPGSFTGIRVGLAAALGLSLASGVPVVGVSSFQVVGAGLLHAADAASFRGFVLMDSRREEPFLVEIGTDDACRTTPKVTSVADFDAMLERAGPAIVTGDAPALLRGRAHFPQQVRVLPRSPDAALVAALAADPDRRFDLPAKPVYIRPPDVTMPKLS